jgi:hypothetical protein
MLLFTALMSAAAASLVAVVGEYQARESTAVQLLQQRVQSGGGVVVGGQRGYRSKAAVE